VGGAARWFSRAEDPADITAAHTWCAEQDAAMFVLGGGSNLVVADEGVHSLVLQIGLGGTTFTRDGEDTLVRARAGESWDAVVATTVDRGLAGLESLSGIPGSVGGTPIQNVGAYGQEVGDVIVSVTALDRSSGEMTTIDAKDCGFAYRMSRFKSQDVDRFVVCDVTFRLRPGAPSVEYPDVVTHLAKAGITAPSVADVRSAVLTIRSRKGMVLDAADADTRSVGSFFMNPIVPPEVRERIALDVGGTPPGFWLADGRVKIPAAWLIERAGFQKGHEDGAVGISTKHPLAIVNRGGATAGDVLRLATRIKRQVVDQFGVWLRTEPAFVGFSADPDVEYLQKAGD
jgi:UDP-N-acetylmuramate dehydrogenase